MIDVEDGELLDPKLDRCVCGRRPCATGTEESWRCPWLVKNPSKLGRNNHCGLCMECVKACPNENLSLRARPFCSDLAVRGLDEAWMALVMIALVFLVLIGGIMDGALKS